MVTARIKSVIARLLLFLLVASQVAEPRNDSLTNADFNDGLAGPLCYQCATEGSAADIKCASNATWSDEDRRSRTVSCPFVNGFCFVRTTTGNRNKRTWRGCVAPVTKQGLALRPGCLETYDNSNIYYVVCLCQTDRCNRASGSRGNCLLLLLVVSLLLTERIGG